MLTRIPHAAAICAGLIASVLPASTPRAATYRPVYVCRDAVPVTFSDRPCGLPAEARVLRVHDPGPGSAPSVARAPSTESTRPKVEPRIAEAKPPAADDRCRRLREERERLDDVTRAGGS